MWGRLGLPNFVKYYKQVEISSNMSQCQIRVQFESGVQGCTGQPFFASWRGGAEEKNFGLGQAVKSSERGRVTVKLEAFSGWGGAGRGSLEKFQDRAGPGQPFSLGPGWGVHPWSIYAP